MARNVVRSSFLAFFLWGILVLPGLGCSGVFLCTGGALVPTIVTISPSPISAFDFQTGGTIFISGTNFVPASVVFVNGVNHPTVFVNGGELRVTLFPVDIRPGGLSFVVSNPRASGLSLFCTNGGNSGTISVFISG